MKSSERLVVLLRSQGWDVPNEYKFQSLSPGRHGKAVGAWSWAITGNGFECGSPDTVKECLASRKPFLPGPHNTIYAD